MAEYIEREKAYEAVLFATCGSGYQYEATYAIDRIPEADVAPVVHGYWCKELVPFRDKLGNQHFGSCCSKCGGIFDRTKFCGGCGAKMDGEG